MDAQLDTAIAPDIHYKHAKIELRALPDPEIFMCKLI